MNEPSNQSNGATGAMDWLRGGGSMGEMIRGMDWSKTPLGPVESWPQSLRTTASLCLASNFPINLIWGPSRIQIYNDGYWPICGAKYRDVMGEDFKVSWFSAWPAIGEAHDRAWAGETAFLENTRMFLERNGYPEETFFTFSFSPIRDESGAVGGLFHPVNEVTSQLLSERRLKLLRDLADRTLEVSSVEEACKVVLSTLKEGAFDLPFAALYRVAPDSSGARLAGVNHLAAGCAAAPEQVSFDPRAEDLWGLGLTSQSGVAREIDQLAALFGPIESGPYPEDPKRALVMPIAQPGGGGTFAILIVGISSRLPFDEPYRTFCRLLNSAVANALVSAEEFERERKRSAALAEIDRAKTEFFSNVSHEFRTPLTLILGPIEDLLRPGAPELPPSARDLLTIVHGNGLRLLKLVNTLLDFSRVEAGGAKASYEALDLAQLTAELASVFRSAVERGGLRFKVDCPPLARPVYIDRSMWEKIVFNLLSNALKFTFHGEIAVGLSATSTHAVLSVRDTGTGIAPDQLSHLFERFYRVQGAQSRTHEGSGIGLALVQELVKFHGGAVRVSSKPGAGTEFLVEIPFGAAHLAPDRIGAGPAPRSDDIKGAFLHEAMRWIAENQPVAAAPSTGGAVPAPAAPRPGEPSRARILLADDNADMRDYVGRILGEYWRVETVPDGQIALAAAQTERPDLVLTDVMMPGLNGFELLARLRGDPELRDVPVVMLSARAGEEARVDGLQAGADDYLVKPFSARELIARVKSHLELSQMRSAREKLARHALELQTVVADRTAELTEALRTMETFNYSIAHDLRAPIRAIRGFAEALRDELGSEPAANVQAYLERVTRNAERMDRMINDLLRFSQVSHQRIEPETVDAEALVRDISTEVLAAAGNRNATIEVELPPESRVIAQRTLLHQVLTNLLGNAVKFVPSSRSPRVIVRGEAEAGALTITIQDNGVGIPPADQAQLFGLFQRLPSGSAFPGTGVGLAIVRKAIQRMRGDVGVRSEGSDGSTFWVRLPLAA